MEQIKFEGGLLKLLGPHYAVVPGVPALAFKTREAKRKDGHTIIHNALNK